LCSASRGGSAESLALLQAMQRGDRAGKRSNKGLTTNAKQLTTFGLAFFEDADKLLNVVNQYLTEMDKVLNLLLRVLRDQDGVTAIEYALIASLISIAAVTVIGTIGTNLSSTFSTVAGKL
jgi:pilus assembly protein Flp/PilA